MLGGILPSRFDLEIKASPILESEKDICRNSVPPDSLLIIIDSVVLRCSAISDRSIDMYLDMEMNGPTRAVRRSPHAGLASADWKILQNSLAKGEPVQLDGKSLSISEVISVAL